jgi:hypothetical protein
MNRLVCLVLVVILCAGCSALTTSIPLGSAPGSPIATATSFRFFWDSSVSVSTPDGISLTYGSKPSENTPLGSFWMKSTLDSMTALANSQAAQAAMQGYMMGSGGGIPNLGATAPATGALQKALQDAGCPLASKLSPQAFASLLSALAGSGVGMNVESLLPLLGAGE